jgi:tRNA pseudouridine55 synthase
VSRRDPQLRDVDGLLLLDKPSGISSNQALQHARRAVGARKAGHTGTLDLMASGLLAICFGEATKLCGYLLDARKSYRAEVVLGVATSTGDREGTVTEVRPCTSLTRAELEAVCAGFLGTSLQVPPMYSALKHAGQPLYELARAGQAVDRAAREIEISELQVIDCQPAGFSLDICCSKGTYVRTLVEDIGRALGYPAHLGALRRTRVGEFSLESAIGPEALMQAAARGETADCILPPDQVVAQLEAIPLSYPGALRVIHGQAALDAAPGPTGPARLYAPGPVFLGVGERMEDGRVLPRRLFAAASDTSRWDPSLA